MNFQQPHFLWFLFLLLIPLIIHLVNFQRTRVLYFPGVYRLMEKMQQARKQKQVQNWLVWLIRTLALLGIVLAFALPTCTQPNGQKSGIDRYILVVDNSLSAKVAGTNGIPFEKMRTEIRQFLEGMESEKLVYLIVQSSDDGSGWLSAEEVVKIIDTLDCYSQYNGWKQWKEQVDQAVKLGVTTAGLQLNRTRALVFTDLDNATERGISLLEDNSTAKADSLKSNKLLQSGAENLSWQVLRFPLYSGGNVSVDSAWTSDQKDSLALPGIVVKINNYSSKATSIPVSLKSMGRVLGNKQVEVQANGSATVNFPSGLGVVSEQGKSLGSNARLFGEGYTVSLNEDSYPWDDILYVHSTPQWKLNVGVLGELGALERVFSVQPRIRYQSLGLPILANSLKQLNAVCLLGNETLTAQDESVLQDFMDNGGVVLHAIQRYLPGGKLIINTPLGKYAGKVLNQDFRIDNSGFSHPVFADAFDKLPEEGTSIPTIKSRIVLNDNSDFSVVLQGENNELLLAQRTWGRGSYWFWTSDLTQGSADWMRSSWVVPTFTELISANNKRNFPLYGTVKTESVVVVPGLNSMTEGGIPIWYLGEDIPTRVDFSSRVSWIKEWQQQIQGNGGVYMGEQPERAGFYAVKTDSDYRLLAMNVSRSESSFKPLADLDEVCSRVGIENVELVDGSITKQATDLSDSSGSWRMLLWISLGFLLVETYVQWRKNIQNRQG